MHGGVVYKIDLDPSIRIATALALLIAVVLSTQPSRYQKPLQRGLLPEPQCQLSVLSTVRHESAPTAWRRAPNGSRPFVPRAKRESVKAIHEAGVASLTAPPLFGSSQPARYAGAFRPLSIEQSRFGC